MHILTEADVEFVGIQESQKIVKPSEFRDEIDDLFENGESMEGVKFPWRKTHNDFGMRKGEVTIWAGINGHGKSQILNQVCASALVESKWLIASLEMPVKRTMQRMIKQISGMGSPSKQYRHEILDYTDGKLWIYDQLDTVSTTQILGMIEFAVKEYGIEFFILDSLIKCGTRPDDYSAQAAFVDKLTWSARRNNIHIHLVHHIAKQADEETMPNKMSVKGAGEITDLAENVIVVHRNKRKERMIREGKEPDSHHDTSISILKQRHNGIESLNFLWFLPDSEQFVEADGLNPMMYKL